MTNAEIANQLRHKAADLDALADQLDPPVTAPPPPPPTWSPVPMTVATACELPDLLAYANQKQEMTGLAFQPAAAFSSTEAFMAHLVEFITT